MQRAPYYRPREGPYLQDFREWPRTGAAVNVPGETVAELPVFDGGSFPASASAVEETEIAFISRRDFQAYCMEHPEVSLKVLKVVGGRLRRLVGIIEELSFTTIRSG